MSCEPKHTREAAELATHAVTPQSFRDGMAKLGAGVSIVTTDGPAGRAGFTATAVCSVTDAPPSLLVCVNRNRSVYAALTENGVLAVNALAPEHKSLSALFGGKTPLAERFSAANWRIGETGAPLLEGAAVSFDCRISQCVEVGSHTVVICEIVGLAGLARDESLVYFNRAYHKLGPATEA